MLYSKRLVKENIEDVLAAIEQIQDLPRTEGELAFPEVGLILDMASMHRTALLLREANKRMEANRGKIIKEFWEWAPQWMADTGNSEEELLRRWPAMRGTKPTERSEEL